MYNVHPLSSFFLYLRMYRINMIEITMKNYEHAQYVQCTIIVQCTMYIHYSHTAFSCELKLYHEFNQTNSIQSNFQ